MTVVKIPMKIRMDRQDADHGKAQQDPNEQGPREIVRREGELLPGSQLLIVPQSVDNGTWEMGSIYKHRSDQVHQRPRPPIQEQVGHEMLSGEWKTMETAFWLSRPVFVGCPHVWSFLMVELVEDPHPC